MGWLIALGVLSLLTLIPLGISARYDSRGARVFFKVGPFRFRVSLKDKDTEKKDILSAKEQGSPKDIKEEQTEKEGIREVIQPLFRAVVDFLSGVRKRIRVKRLELKIILAGDDPADLAINYGRAWVALGNLMPQLERFLVIKKRDLEVECDFTTDKTVILARVEIRIFLIRAVALIARHGMRLIREYYKFKNKRKGGAKT